MNNMDYIETGNNGQGMLTYNEYTELAEEILKIPAGKINRFLEFMCNDGDPELEKFATWIRERRG